MLANRDEAEELKKSHEFKRILAEYDRDADENEILSELIRRNHVTRSCEYVDKFKANYDKFKCNCLGRRDAGAVLHRQQNCVKRIDFLLLRGAGIGQNI